MKISLPHANRIAALEGLRRQLAKWAGDDTAENFIEMAQDLSYSLILAAPDSADPGRLTHAIDSLRAALEAFVTAADIGHYKPEVVEVSPPVAVDLKAAALPKRADEVTQAKKKRCVSKRSKI